MSNLMGWIADVVFSMLLGWFFLLLASSLGAAGIWELLIILLIPAGALVILRRNRDAA